MRQVFLQPRQKVYLTVKTLGSAKVSACCENITQERPKLLEELTDPVIEEKPKKRGKGHSKVQAL